MTIKTLKKYILLIIISLNQLSNFRKLLLKCYISNYFNPSQLVNQPYFQNSFHYFLFQF